MAKQLFAVISSRGPGWQNSRPMEEQQDWHVHAAFMDALVADGFVLLGGPLEGTSRVLLIVRADNEDQIRMRLSGDSWIKNDLLRVTEVAPWMLRLGSLV
jgi:hypothetical protein